MKRSAAARIVVITRDCGTRGSSHQLR